jgi:hypothetical protein
VISKPITPKLHGLIDYGFSAVQAFVPTLLGVNKKAVKLYQATAINLLVYNIVTDHPVSAKSLIAYKTHYKIDVANVAGLALLTFYKGIRKDKKTLAFHVALVALAAANVLLTDWDAKPVN